MKIGIMSGAANYLSTWDERFAHLKVLGYEAVETVRQLRRMVEDAR